MAPKAKGKVVDKNKLAKSQKAVEDKTFGLKNKNKSAKVQQYVTQMKKTVDDVASKQKAAANAHKDKKAAEAERQKELAELFAVAIKQPKVPIGVDPKSMLCEFFRHGQCTKGFKCKFSHDLNVERKGGKIDLFSDRRGGEDEEEEGMDEWDQEKLEAVVNQKHGTEKNRPTDIICKFFLDAVERKQYGWFWQCPNGKECKYRHALPPGYVLKSQMKELMELEAANTKSIEDVIEEERRQVEAKTPITEETFRKWRDERRAEKQKAQDEEEADRKRKGIMTGREIFMQEGFLAEDDMGAHDAYTREEDEEEAIAAMEAQAAAQRAQGATSAAAAAPPNGHPGGSRDTAGSGSSGNGAAQLPGAAQASSSAANGHGTGLHLSAEEEALFTGDSDEDDDEDEGDIDHSELDALEARLAGTGVE